MRLCYIMAFICAVLALPASAATFTLTGDVDGRVRNVDGVFFAGSTAPILDLTNNEVFLSTGGFRTNTVLEFDLSFLAPGQTITAIDLNMSNMLVDNTLFVNGYSGNGTLEAADSMQAGNSLGVFGVTAGANGPLSLATGFANSLIGLGATHFGLNIGVNDAFASGSPTGFQDFSVTFTATDVVPAVPLPAGGLLLITALGGFVRLRAKRRP